MQGLRCRVPVVANIKTSCHVVPCCGPSRVNTAIDRLGSFAPPGGRFVDGLNSNGANDRFCARSYWLRIFEPTYPLPEKNESAESFSL